MEFEESGIRAPEIDEVRSAHLIGIGGAAMTPLATILLQMGVCVTGSDLAEPSSCETLRALGAQIHLGHRAEHVGEAGLVIASSAIRQDNPEIAEALSRGIPVIRHSAALGSLMRPRRGVAIAGTHGKTTTSALVSFVLANAGIDVSFHVGSELLNYGVFGHYGRGELLVAEADEYDRRFLDYEPEVVVVTNVESDHLDYFGSFDEVVGAFRAFLGQVRHNGLTVVCEDDPVARTLPTAAGLRMTYGFSDDADWQILSWAPSQSSPGSRFTLHSPDGAVHQLEIGLVGRHNALNAAGVVAVCNHLGLSMNQVAAGLRTFRGTRRRFELIGVENGVTVVDDYAHHPTAIRVTLEGARAHFPSGIWCIFQPHTAHRTESLFDDFCSAFAEADHVILTPTYRPLGREDETDDPSVRRLVEAMDHTDARLMAPDEAMETIAREARPGDLVLVAGAGDITRLAPRIVSALHRKTPT